MTYKEIINAIEGASIANPSVRSFYYGDLENLNKQHNIPYPRITLIPTAHEFLTSSTNILNFTLVYVERLTETRYKRDIQSVAISTIKDIINRFKAWGEDGDKFEDMPYSVSYSSVNVYTDPEKFVDSLSGAYVNISIEVNDDDGDCYYEPDDN